MFRMIFSNIDDAYEFLEEYIKENGYLITDQRDDVLYQLPFISLSFKNHINNVGNIDIVRVPQSSILPPSGLYDYSKQLQSGDIQDFIYTYGNRFIEHFGVNQYETIINRIKENLNTRRAVAVTYDPLEDKEIEDIPCLIMLKVMVNNDKLDMGVVFRSNDIKYAFPSNMYGLMQLQLMFSKELNIPVGNFYYVGFDVHWKVV